MRLRFRIKLLATFVAAVGLFTGAMAGLLYVSQAGMFRASLGAVVGATVVPLAAQVRATDIEALQAAADLTSEPAFARVRGQLLRVQTAVNDAFADLARERGIEAGDLVVDAYILGPTDEPGIGRLLVTVRPEEAGRPYDMRRFPAMMRGWEQVSLESEVLEDEFGRTLSAYAPIRDARGRTVALLGVDSPGRIVEMAKGRLLGVAAGMFLLATAASVVLAWFIARRLNQPIDLLHAAMARLAAGESEVRVAELRTGDEFEPLLARFNDMAAQVDRRRRMERSLTVASEVQRQLLPKHPPRIAGFQFSGGARYCDETGGDYYDAIDLTEAAASGKSHPLGGDAAPARHWGLTIADVSGHGIGPALLMAWIGGVLRTEAPEHGQDVSALFREINRHLLHSAEGAFFVTLFYGHLDAQERRLTWTSAGHEPGLLYRARDGSVEVLKATDVPLGVLADATFPPGGSVTLEPGDILLLTTDGITQARNPAGEFLGCERLAGLLRERAGAGVADIHQAVVRLTADHRGRLPQDDDVTLVVLKAE